MRGYRENRLTVKGEYSIDRFSYSLFPLLSLLGDSFALHTNNLRRSLNTSGSFVNTGNSFIMSDAGSGSGSFVSIHNGGGAASNGISSFGASGSYLDLNNFNNNNNSNSNNSSNNNINNIGSFVNNNPAPVVQMPPPRPVKRTPVNNHTNHTNVPHSAGVNGYASGIATKPGGFVPLMRRRRFGISSPFFFPSFCFCFCFSSCGSRC